MTALLGPDHRLSTAAQTALAAALGGSPGPVRVHGGLLARLLTSRRRTGLTLGSRVLIHPELHRRACRGWDPRILRLLVHEAVHVRQFRTLGVAGFLRRYVGAYLDGRLRGLGHRAAYRAIPLEEEARAAAARAGTERRGVPSEDALAG